MRHVREARREAVHRRAGLRHAGNRGHAIEDALHRGDPLGPVRVARRRQLQLRGEDARRVVTDARGATCGSTRAPARRRTPGARRTSRSARRAAPVATAAGRREPVDRDVDALIAGVAVRRVERRHETGRERRHDRASGGEQRDAPIHRHRAEHLRASTARSPAAPAAARRRPRSRAASRSR